MNEWFQIYALQRMQSLCMKPMKVKIWLACIGILWKHLPQKVGVLKTAGQQTTLKNAHRLRVARTEITRYFVKKNIQNFWFKFCGACIIRIAHLAT